MCCTNDLAGHKTENVSDKVTEDMIGCLCKFWYHDERDYTIAVLMDVACHRKFPSYKGNDCWYSHCQPVKPNEVKFYDYDDRYNCCAENEVLRLKIVKLENDFKTANKNAQHWFDVAREKAEENIQLIEKIEELKK